MLSDIEIAQSAELKPIEEIAQKLSIPQDKLTKYGDNMAKIDYRLAYRDGKLGKLILVTGTNPTPAGEGKTTVAIGLADAIAQRGKNACVCLREPSLGPVFGVKGGAAGGGYSQVVPMENINLHFTGDIHAIESANNLLAAMIDNHIYQGNELNINPEKITWRRCMDMNDRHLRKIKDGLADEKSVEREDGFDITVASEVMAVFCLSRTLSELKDNLGNIIFGYDKDDKPLYVRQLHMEGAMTAILKDAFNPNLVQTLEGTPAIIHGGPFANIAHGCNSIVATKLGMSLSNYVVTEAGFGSDLGAEKFLDIKCPKLGFAPDCIVIVTTTRALKYNGNGILKDGLCNLGQHIDNMKGYNIPVVVAINAFGDDVPDDLSTIGEYCESKNVKWEITTAHDDGSFGARALANSVIELCNESHQSVVTAYGYDNTIIQRANELATTIYHASAMSFTIEAAQMCKKIEEMGFSNLPICVAKTQYSFSDNPKLLGAPNNFIMNCREVRLCAGAGFIVLICGKIMTMPGLPKNPAAEKIDVDNEGKIIGLF
jgi:formate--tetrahydrofolate ligase